jgi:hypothetical protein
MVMKKFFTAAAVTFALLVGTSADARRVQLHIPVICDNYETVLADFKSMGVVSMTFLGDVDTSAGERATHQEMWTDADGKIWVMLTVFRAMTYTGAFNDDGSPMQAEITVGCVMGTGGQHKLVLPGTPA